MSPSLGPPTGRSDAPSVASMITPMGQLGQFARWTAIPCPSPKCEGQPRDWRALGWATAKGQRGRAQCLTCGAQQRLGV